MTAGRQETALGLGERLRSARRAQALTLEQAAQALKLEAHILRALEENRFDALGAPVFVRGHLRAYARLLNLDEATVLEAYRAADPASGAAPPMVREREQPVGSGPGPVALGALGLVVLGAAILVWYLQEPSPAPAPAPVAAVPAPAPPVTALPLVGSTDESMTPAGEPAPVDGPGDPSGSVVLTLDFSQSSWVEVSDRRGRLLTGEQPAGTRQELRGEPPFDLVLGNYPAVRLALDGVELSPPDSARAPGSRVARFRIPARATEPAAAPDDPPGSDPLADGPAAPEDDA